MVSNNFAIKTMDTFSNLTQKRDCGEIFINFNLLERFFSVVL